MILFHVPTLHCVIHLVGSKETKHGVAINRAECRVSYLVTVPVVTSERAATHNCVCHCDTLRKVQLVMSHSQKSRVPSTTCASSIIFCLHRVKSQPKKQLTSPKQQGATVDRKKLPFFNFMKQS